MQIQLDQRQAEALLRWLVREYELAMAERWHADKYRYVPEGFRAKRLLQDHPYIAGINRTARALRKQLEVAK